MSPVGGTFPAWLGTMALSCQVFPPSLEMKIGALAPPSGSGVNAEAAMNCGLLGLTARFGSLSWFVSPLIDLGIRLTTRIIWASSGRGGRLLRYGRGSSDQTWPTT